MGKCRERPLIRGERIELFLKPSHEARLADLTSYVFSRLSTLSIEQRSGGLPPKVGYSRNELFQIVGRDLEPLEKACQRAGFTAGEYRNRSRRILKLFSFLKK